MSVWRVLRAIHHCNYKLERLSPPCCENEESMEAGWGGFVCVRESLPQAVVRLYTSQGLILRPPALAYTPVSLFVLIHPPFPLCSESLKMLTTEYQFNLGVTPALHASRIKWPWLWCMFSVGHNKSVICSLFQSLPVPLSLSILLMKKQEI